jgi:hypothetical protein
MNAIAGSFLFTVEENRLDAKWLASNGTVMDKFTMMKNVNKVTTLSSDLSASMTLNASWVGNYSWSSSETTRSITLPPATSGTYTVTDPYGCVTDVFNITTTPLPVKLTSFSATVQEDKVHLNWKTASEINNDFFEVQRFNNSPNEITILGKVNGNGSTNELHSYQFIDHSPLNGISFYRLKQVDYDGKSEYSNLISAEFKANDVVLIFPNPGNGLQMGVSIRQEGGPVHIVVQDARGVDVATFSTTAPPNVQLIKFDTPLPTGLYFIRVKTNSGISILKWIVR